MRISIIVPALEEAASITATLSALQPLRAQGHEVIVVDGGSRDATLLIARLLADRAYVTGAGRATQMNFGAGKATGDVLLFLHADTLLPPDAAPAIRVALAGGAAWGRFDVAILGKPRVLRVVAAMMNLRSRLTGIATGDQAIFVRRAAFAAAGAFPPIPLMEDVALSSALKRCAGRPACLRTRVTTSGRRWQARGPWRTIFTMWRLRLAYALGADPATLARHYR
ncbi:MAG: TIGR04283 family arsenosugar biosynthesis glycosyltransferase [Burkholderiales bacterium]|nr:TIGR04283 family arsenosugar biosynthesis glycosyltransferase [Burkholderiales bacterium]